MQPRIADLPFYLVGVDPQSGEEVVSHHLPVWVDIPRFDGDLAWFDVVQAPTIAEDSTVDYPNAGFLVMNYKTGQIIDQRGYCENQANAFVANGRAWLGCWDGEASFNVYDPAQPDDTITYEDVGEYPNVPLEADKHLIFTYRHSGTVGIFDTETGEWVHNFQVGGYPAEPILYDDHLWVYSAATDTLQRITDWD